MTGRGDHAYCLPVFVNLDFFRLKPKRSYEGISLFLYYTIGREDRCMRSAGCIAPVTIYFITVFNKLRRSGWMSAACQANFRIFKNILRLLWLQKSDEPVRSAA